MTFTANSKLQFIPHVTKFSLYLSLTFYYSNKKVVVSGQLHAFMRVTLDSSVFVW